ncbi:hypothetical protein Glove_425g16 [Diversispora epigaea]|uniref:Uncharacterized protein n=1 Tax=Diversispora epigaea TaxID=1348612 RepID=A0A397GUF3_9GLOM|nr:hypothetical protein Glove_425g16 [Diversispora epigaea]
MVYEHSSSKIISVGNFHTYLSIGIITDSKILPRINHFVASTCPTRFLSEPSRWRVPNKGKDSGTWDIETVKKPRDIQNVQYWLKPNKGKDSGTWDIETVKKPRDIQNVQYWLKVFESYWKSEMYSNTELEIFVVIKLYLFHTNKKNKYNNTEESEVSNDEKVEEDYNPQQLTEEYFWDN